jgi:PGF-CTERM protein
VDVVTDDQNGSLYVHVDSAAMLESDNFPDGNSFEEGDTVNVTLKFYEESDLVDENTKIFATFEIVEPDAEFDSNAEDADGDDIVEVEAAADQRITGTTNLAPGTEVNVRARATGDSPFLFSNETTVTPNGTFNVTFDFSNVSSEQEFDLEVSSPSEINDVSIDGVVAAAPSANVSISNQSGNGQTVMVDSVTMSEGGFVTIHDSTLVSDGDAIGSVRGTSEYLENGTTENVTVSLDAPLNESGTVIAMPHLDTNGNEVYDFVTSEGAEDSPYTTAAGEIVTDSANYTVEDGEIATVSIEAQEGDGSSVTVASAFLPNGGFVTIHDSTVSDDPIGSVRGTSEYLEPGTSEDITVALDDPFTESQVAIAMPHRDTNGNQTYDFVTSEGEEDAPYLNADDQIVIDSADYTIPTPTPTPTEPPTDSPTPTETAEPTDSPTPMDTTEPPTTTSTGQPGFTVIVALMAFLAAALLAIRRD